MIVLGKDIRANVREDVDVCIVGSGAGGAMAALELSKRGLKVVVLEEGKARFSPDFPDGIKDAFKTLYRNTGADAATGIPTVIVPTGKCLGGTTVVNMGTCFRAPEAVLRTWQGFGLPDYGPEGLAPYYDEVEREMSIQAVKPEVMGRGGEIIAEGATRLGLHPRPIRRNVSDACRGCGNCAYGCKQDAKQSMIVKVIPEAEQAGAVFYCDTRAETLVHDGERITGVHGRVLDPVDGCFRSNVDIAAKVVVLAAGALHTPALLLKNNVGNGSGQVARTSNSTSACAPWASSTKSSTPTTASARTSTSTTTSTRGSCSKPPSPGPPPKSPASSASTANSGTSANAIATWPASAS